ncbi:MAG: tRNA pseudouridine(55) synthase TruB [Candidatus Aminicenantes bacterium 4484_214]|nr:MAG: tRNA pseudouridine(55) synthase TruB [Candidatus Aminicenantes bacterium 4484_214]
MEKTAIKAGLILIDKPQGLTSHDVVRQIRKILNQKQVGHFGTLDPLATGLLLIAVGKATRFFPYYGKMDKSYFGTIRLGWATSTYDREGQPLTKKVESFPSLQEVTLALQNFRGKIKQVPPLFSAKKLRGQPLYKLAREKKESPEKIRPQPAEIKIYRLQLIDYQPPWLKVEIDCSSGTYIRSLAHDLGQKLGCGAHLENLSRTKIGHLKLSQSFSLDEVTDLARHQEFEKFVIPLEKLLPFFPKIIVNQQEAALLSRGNIVHEKRIVKIFPAEETFSFHQPSLPAKMSHVYRAFNLEGQLLGLVKYNPESKSFHAFLVLKSQ